MTRRKAGPKGSAIPKASAEATSGDVAQWVRQFDAETQSALARLAERWNAPNGKAWLRLIDLLEAAKSDPAIAGAAPTLELLDLLIALLSDCGPDSAMAPLHLVDEHLPLGSIGKKFSTNSGRGEGAVKKLVRELLPKLEKKLKRKASALELWHACAAKRGHGIKFATAQTWGTPLMATPAAGEPASWARFQVIVSEVRKSSKP